MQQETRRFNVKPHRRDILDLRAEAQARGGAGHQGTTTLAQLIARVNDTPIVIDDKDRAFLKAHGIADPDRWLSDQGLGL